MTVAEATTFRCPSCYGLDPVQGGRTLLQEFSGPLQALAGHHRFYNLLDREGFRYVEDVTATPGRCLLELRNVGLDLAATSRRLLPPKITGALQVPQAERGTRTLGDVLTLADGITYLRPTSPGPGN